MAKGKFITFEGIDGSGKTTVAKQVADELKQKGVDATYTCEPTNTWLGEAVKTSYSKDISPFTELLLFLADRATHTVQIKKWLEEGKVVVCDRYADSTYAYQAVMLKDELKELNVEPVEWLKDLSRPFVIEPDLTVLLKIDPEVALKRIKNKELRFERKEFLDRVLEVYLKLAGESSRFEVIDAAQPLEEVVQRSLELVLLAL
jgi:dTMP kinase